VRHGRQAAPLVLAAIFLLGLGLARAPSSTDGRAVVGVPVPLGHIGDIKFWAPNRGLLITAGNEAIAAGLYYYDGVSWSELSTVCGGTDGRIAWAGPDDFWTISDQQVGQQLAIGENGHDRSLCHFVNGQVVASYAEPIGVPSSYQRMDAAACSGANDCWFGGERLPAGPNSGAFHLHWNGQSLTPTPSLEAPEPKLADPAREVADMALFKGQIYESVRVKQDDPPSETESSSQPYFLHRIAAGSSNPFVPMIPEGASPSEPFTFGGGSPAPWQLSAFRLSAVAGGLWAIAGPNGEASASGSAQATALLMRSSQFEQIKLNDPNQVLAPTARITGVAAEPGMQDAWLSILGQGEVGSPTAPARVTRVRADGTVEPETVVPEPGEGLGRKGSAEAIACPAPGDCWLATSQGWLFHLGANQPRDSDPNFRTLIASRPRDASLPFVAPDEAPPNTSGDNPASIPPPPSAPVPEPTVPLAHEALFSQVKVRLINGTTLALTFTLATKSRVRLLALRGKRSVAATRRVVLARGRHTLKLRLSLSRWPNKLDLQVKAIGAVPLVQSGSSAGPPGGPTTVGTSFRAPSPSRLPSAFSAPLP
jgi:hypothetical protein